MPSLHFPLGSGMKLGKEAVHLFSTNCLIGQHGSHKYKLRFVKTA